MDDYRATAFYVAVWYAFLAALGAVLLIVLQRCRTGRRLPDRRQPCTAVRARSDGPGGPAE